MTGLLKRCLEALHEALAPGIPLTREQSTAARRGVAAVLEHLAAEIIAEANRCPGLTAHQVAGRFLDAAKEVA
jgi:hypothetical protein